MKTLVRFLIRRASERDAMKIAGIHVRSWRAACRGLVPDEFLDSLDEARRAVVWKGLLGTPEETVLVAMKGGRMAGFCSLVASRDSDAGRGTAEIASFYVDPPAWGRGAGSELVEEVLELARAKGFRRITLWALSASSRARRFYEKAGFWPDGTEKTEARADYSIHVLRYARDL